jgi:hypothetical protein
MAAKRGSSASSGGPEPISTITSVTTARREINRAEAKRLLSLSREARWRYPSFSGSPVLAGHDAWAEELLSERESFAPAARWLIEGGDDHEALELAANVWRLWVMARDPLGGRAFLAPFLDGLQGESRGREHWRCMRTEHPLHR